MQSGDLNKRVVLQYYISTPDLYGNSADTWASAATVFAAIWPVRSVESIRGDKNVSVANVRIRIRYRYDVAANWRVKYGDRYFFINGPPILVGANEFLDLMCYESTL